ALPSIKSDLDFSQTNLQWVISAYAIMFGGALLLGGRLPDLLGRRRLFVAGLAGFAATSLPLAPGWSGAGLLALSARPGLGGGRRALAPEDDGRGGGGPHSGARDLRRRTRQRRGGRRPARRPPPLLPELVVDLLRQRARRPRRDRAHAAAAAREPLGTRPPTLRPPRRRLGHRRADAARLRDHARDQRRLGRDDDARALRQLGSPDRDVHHDRAA